jgi:hypothetical protein
MPRPFSITLCAALLAALALAPAPAAAKNLQAARICGPDACREVPKDDLEIGLVEGGGSGLGPERPEPYYRVRVTFGGHGAPSESWWIVVLPRGGFTGFTDGPGGYYEWSSISAPTARMYERLAGDVEPFPAERLRLAQADPDEPAVAPSVAQDQGDGESGGHGVAIAGAIAGAVLLVAVGWSAWRRRRG